MSSKQNYISLARVICALGVVMIHTNGECFYEFNIDGCWPISTVIGASLSFAVPLFLMISGATLIDFSERYSLKEYFQKRAQRILLPFLFWGCVIGVWYKHYTGRIDTQLLYNFLVWQIGIYLCIPLFSYLQKEVREKIIAYVVAISFVVNFCIPFICSIFQINLFYEMPFEMAQCYLMYPLVGYLISKKKIPKGLRWSSYVFAVLALLLMICGTYMYSIELKQINYSFLGYPNVTCLVYSTGVFIFIKQVGAQMKNEKVLQGIEHISGYTFSIYLIHWYLIYFGIDQIVSNPHSIVYKLVAPVFVFTISIPIVWILRKIPFVKYLLP